MDTLSDERWTSVNCADEAGTGTGTGTDIDETARYQPLWVRLACILLDFLTQTYDQIRIVPEIVLFERWICEPYLPNGIAYSHELCKSHDIQYQLAQLRSWRAFFDGVASMHCRPKIELVFPWICAEKFGSPFNSGTHGPTCR